MANLGEKVTNIAVAGSVVLAFGAAVLLEGQKIPPPRKIGR